MQTPLHLTNPVVMQAPVEVSGLLESFGFGELSTSTQLRVNNPSAQAIIVVFHVRSPEMSE